MRGLSLRFVSRRQETNALKGDDARFAEMILIEGCALAVVGDNATQVLRQPGAFAAAGTLNRNG